VWLITLLLSVGPAFIQWCAQGQAVQPGTLPDAALIVSEQLYTSGALGPINRIALLLSAVLMIEIVGQLCVWQWQQVAILRRAGQPTQRLVYQVRIPRSTPQPGQRQHTTPSADLFRAIAAAIPSQGQRWGHAPYVAFTLLGEPDQATALQYVVAGGSAAQRAHLADVLRAAVVGEQPQAVVEQVHDQLHATVTTGTAPCVAWQHYRLLLPAYYPLRFVDDTEQSDLLGALAVALQPQANVTIGELQMTVQPIRSLWGSFLHRGWRGAGKAMQLRLQQRDDYALADDADALDTKLAGAPYYVTLRAVIAATDAPAAMGMVATMTGVLGQYESRTSHLVQRWMAQPLHLIEQRDAPSLPRQLQLALARAPQFLPAPLLLVPALFVRLPTILSSGELAALWHLPTPRISTLLRHLPSRVLSAPLAAFVTANDTTRLIVGHAQRSSGTWQPVGPTLHDLHEMLHVIAGQGAGKTRLVVNLVEQSLPFGCTLMNGKGDDQGGASLVVRQLLPVEDEARLVLWNPLDAMWPISFNPLAGIDLQQPGMEDQLLGQVQAVFQRIDAEGMRNGPVMQMLLDMATLVVLGGGGQPTIAHIEQVLIDAQYRATLLPQVLNPKVRAYWEARRDGYSEREQQSVEALQRRFHKLLTSELTRSLVMHPAPRFDWGRAIDERWIVLADLPHNRLGGMAGVIGMLLFGAFIRAALQRSGDAQSRLNYPLFIDEVHVFLENSDGKDFALALSQLRGFGIPTAYLHQALAQLGPYKELMQVNAGSRIIMRTKYPDSAALAREYQAWGLSETDISALDPTQQQYAVLRINGQQCGPFSLRPLPWPTPRQAQATMRPHVDAWHTLWAHRATGRIDQAQPWQQHLPPDTPAPELDQEVLRLVYGQHREHHLVERCADPQRLSDGDWMCVLERWNAIRQWHRRCLLDQPDLIKDRLLRQQ
jgi:hypothetical protein